MRLCELLLICASVYCYTIVLLRKERHHGLVRVAAGRFERGKKFVTDGLEKGDFKATVSKTFDFEDMVEAHKYMESNQQFGKIVVTVGG